MALSLWMKTEQFFDSTFKIVKFLKIIPATPSAVNLKMLFTAKSSTGNSTNFVSSDESVISFVLITSSSSSMLSFIVTGSVWLWIETDTR